MQTSKMSDSHAKLRTRSEEGGAAGTDGQLGVGTLTCAGSCHSIGRMPSARRATSPVDLAPAVFSTAGLAAPRRVELWEAHNASALIGLDVRTPGPLEATEVNVRLPRARLARVTASAHVVERSADVIARCPADSIAIYLTLRGDAWFTSAGGSYRLRPGQAVVCAADQPFARRFAGGLEELVVTVPCSALSGQFDASLAQPKISAFSASGSASRSSGATPIDAATGVSQYARALARLAGRATRTVRPLPPDEAAVIDLAAILTSGPAVAPATAHRAAARSFIEEHLTSPGLGAGQVAAAIGISERQLSRVFAADGTSVPRHILARRLALAYSLLSSPLTGPETVADVAARCGFTSAAYFSHAFRQHFGHRASDLGREAPARG
jgi:AraC-like DNA-binding protein